MLQEGEYLFGAAPPTVLEGTPWQDQVVAKLGPAGSVVLFNAAVWHRGRPGSGILSYHRAA
jgi:hypothetical protein